MVPADLHRQYGISKDIALGCYPAFWAIRAGLVQDLGRAYAVRCAGHCAVSDDVKAVYQGIDGGGCKGLSYDVFALDTLEYPTAYRDGVFYSFKVTQHVSSQRVIQPTTILLEHS